MALLRIAGLTPYIRPGARRDNRHGLRRCDAAYFNKSAAKLQDTSIF
jgi:hypothetical protein